MKKEYYLKNREKILQQKRIHSRIPEVAAKRKEYQKKYQTDNRVALKKFRKQKWKKIKNDKELLRKCREYHLKYYRLHKNDERMILNRKRYWQKTKNNPRLFTEHKERINKWRSTVSGIFTSLKNRGRHDFSLSKNDFLKWYESQPKQCSYCGLTLEQIRKLRHPYNRKNGLVKFSIDRKDNNSGYELKNMTLCCFTCNTIKNNLLTFDEMKIVGKKILIPKFKKLLKYERRKPKRQNEIID